MQLNRIRLKLKPCTQSEEPSGLTIETQLTSKHSFTKTRAKGRNHMTSTTNQTEQFNQTTTEENEALEQLPFTVHLIELRRRLIKCVGLIIALFFMMLPFANQLYEMLSSPLRGRLPEHATMIATDVTATFMAPFKLNFYVAFHYCHAIYFVSNLAIFSASTV